jgi:hypothetical protein
MKSAALGLAQRGETVGGFFLVDSALVASTSSIAGCPFVLVQPEMEKRRSPLV